MKRAVFLFTIFFSIVVFAQENDINYVVDHITTKRGLSHNYVSSILSDDLNMKWIGTENGITKFNGYDFEYIKPSEEFKDLYNENIEVLFMDDEFNLWIGTKSGGLSYLDIKNNHIKNFNFLIDLADEGDLRITALSQDHAGNIWIGTWRNGVFVIDFKNESLLKHYPYNQQVYSIARDFNNDMWFSIGMRLNHYDGSIDKLTVTNIKNQITDILPDPSRNKIWIATSGNNTKLYNFNLKNNSIDSIETKVESNFSKKLSMDKYNRLWIGTWGRGVYRSNETLTSFDKIELFSRQSDKVTNNYDIILDVHHDKNNVTWLATAYGGLVKLLEGNGFENADRKITNSDLKNKLNCTAIHKNLDNLFIGTGEGFHIYNLQTKTLDFSSDRLKKVTSFYIDGKTIYIGTQQQGLAITSLENILNEESYQIYSEQNVDGLKFESNRITGIKKDQYDNIWVSSYNGLHLLDRDKKTFLHQSKFLNGKLPSVIINSFDIRANYLWLATPNGLIKLMYSNKNLNIQKIITTKNGLNSDFICSVTFDINSNLWLSTHTEIVKYNDFDGSIISYGDINGVESTSFNNNSYFNFGNDLIYFGGIDNITYFNPHNIKDLKTFPDVIFTVLKVNNEIIQFRPGNNILNKNFRYADEINLTHDEDFFSTRFVANDFLGNLNIKYRYILEGYQDEWIDLQNRNEINFAGLSPGNYILKVQASRDNQNWSEPNLINIKLFGSPWSSPLAILIYSLLFFAAIIYLIRSNNYKLKLQNSLEIARIDKEKEIELSEAKLNFFTNISHEFRTPLTLIISPLKELIESENISSKVNKNLSLIERNANRLLNLINQLLDFRKADHGLLKLDVSEGNFVRFSKEVHLYFKEAARAKNIKYKFYSEQDEIIFPFDRNKMEIVLCNLLSNAIKYTDFGGDIIMKLESDSKFCKISIKDSGIGMNSEDVKRIFDRFFQIKSANTARMVGSGIGLSFSKKIVELHYGSITVNSDENVGTEFNVKLSMDPNLYEDSMNKGFLKSDNIAGYNVKDIGSNIKNFNIKAKENTILIIDDNLEILNYLKDLLSESYNIIQADNGDIGFKKASTEIPDLIVSDVMMPGKDGITLCKELKLQITTSHIPIILLTARTSSVYEIEGFKTGADDYITKPFNSKIVKARIASLLENREKLRVHLLNKVRFEPTSNELENESDFERAFINKSILLVEENLDNSSFGIETMVDELNMSQSTLYRKIKSLTGLSLTAFIRSVRLKKAANLILSSDLNMNEIAYEVGFNDYKYFKTSFKKQFDCVPSKYKEIIQKT